jgi:tripartite motif-containing protein 2/3/tripartite motif-containing protein 71
VAVDQDGNILVADYGNHRIQKFTPKGGFISAVETRGNGELQFDYPSGIAFNKHNTKVYVVDSNHRVQVLNCINHPAAITKFRFSFSGVFGEFGTGEGQFDNPQGIACDSTGKVYVADTGNHRIQVFTAEMEILREFEVFGSEVDYPIGVAVDHQDRVHVGECGRVLVFTPKGDCIKRLAKKDGDFANSPGLAASRLAMYVCDGDRIQIIRKGFLSSKIVIGGVIGLQLGTLIISHLLRCDQSLALLLSFFVITIWLTSVG